MEVTCIQGIKTGILIFSLCFLVTRTFSDSAIPQVICESFQVFILCWYWFRVRHPKNERLTSFWATISLTSRRDVLMRVKILKNYNSFAPLCSRVPSPRNALTARSRTKPSGEAMPRRRNAWRGNYSQHSKISPSLSWLTGSRSGGHSRAGQSCGVSLSQAYCCSTRAPKQR